MLVRRLAGFAFFVLLAAASLPCSLAAEEDQRQAKGKFEGKNWTFETWGAYAYPAEVGFDDEPGYRVALSNATFNTEVFDRYWDREHALETYHKDDETLIFTLQFDKAGKYAGMSYYFGSGDGCGYCFDGSVVSTVQVKNGRLAGKVKLAGKPGENSFETEFDIPIAPESHGTALPADGGEPGAAYRAYHEAIAAWDQAKTKPFFTDRLQAQWSEKGEEILQAFRKDHPDLSIKIVRGFQKEDTALLLVEGEVSYSKVKTEVQMRKEGGTWRIVDEMLQIRMGD